jgi:hypothetical protein
MKVKVIGVGEFLHDTKALIQEVRGRNREILVTKGDRPYFVVIPYQSLDEYSRRRAWRISKRKKLLKEARLARLRKIRGIKTHRW